MKKQGPRYVVERLLNKMGFSPTLKGTSSLADAILVCYLDPTAIQYVTKRVYPVIAAPPRQKSWKNIEHNLRTAVGNFWNYGNRAFLNEMAGRELLIKPSVGEIIGYISDYIIEEGLFDEFSLNDFDIPPERLN